tara:strand:- start:92 stop:403 length:312 start_codon:yes stop_codon:yes gene_type:complete
MKLKRNIGVITAILLLMTPMSCASIMTQPSTDKNINDEVVITMGDLELILPSEEQDSLDIQKYRPIAEFNIDSGVMVKQTWTSVDGGEYVSTPVGERIPYPVK